MRRAGLKVCGVMVAVTLAAGALAAPVQGQSEAPPADRPVLLGGELEASPPNEASEISVRIRYRFEPGTGDNVEILLMPMGRLMNTPRWYDGQGTVEASFQRVDENTLSAVVPLRESELLLVYNVYDGYAERDGVEAMALPIPTPVSGGGEALRDRFYVTLHAERRYDIQSPFPSSLTVQPSPNGQFVVVGEAPAAPGVVRFGPADLLGPPLEPGEPLGWTFWGLWIALGAVLVGYLVWMFRKERSEPEAGGGGKAA